MNYAFKSWSSNTLASQAIKALREEQQRAHGERVEARQRVNGQPFNDEPALVAGRAS